MDRPTSILTDGVYPCPLCNQSRNQPNTLRLHCKRDHDGARINIRAKPPTTNEERKSSIRESTRQWRAKQPKPLKQRKRKQRPLYTIDDADELGAFGTDECILEYKTSSIPNAGNGVFTLIDLFVGDVVTWCAGEFSKDAAQDRAYPIAVPGGYINGIKIPYEGCGLGTFINREERAQSIRQNCQFVVVEHAEHSVYVTITKNIQAGYELVTTYSRGMRIKK